MYSTSMNSYVPYTYRTRGFPTNSETATTSRFLSSSSSSSNRYPESRFRRSISVAPSAALVTPSYYTSYRKVLSPVRSMIRESFSSSFTDPGREPSKGRTRDDLIDSIIHTRTRENRTMPGYIESTDWEERKALNVDCDQVYPGIILGNGDTVKNMEYLKRIGVTHVLNTAEYHVPVNPSKYPLHGISYYGFHVDDHPSANISRFFYRTTEYIDDALSKGGTVVVNCVMGWSRSATVVAAYLMAKKGLTSTEALQTIRKSRPIRPNPGFLQQLADHENLLNKRSFW